MKKTHMPLKGLLRVIIVISPVLALLAVIACAVLIPVFVTRKKRKKKHLQNVAEKSEEDAP